MTIVNPVYASSSNGIGEVRVLYEDPDFLIIEKPAGLLVHRTRINANLHPRGSTQIENQGESATLADWLLAHYPEVKNVGDNPENRPGIVHRLDRDTSGVMVIARKQSAFDFLKKLFQEGRIKKTYLALVWGDVAPRNGVIRKPIGLRPGTVRRTTHGEKMRLVKDAVTRYQVLNTFFFEGQALTLLGVYPETGRTHQIRVHLQSIGHPVVGDKLYGRSNIKDQKTKMLGIERQFLHAESIEFTTPQGSRLKVGADLPLRLARALDLLSRGAVDPPRNN